MEMTNNRACPNCAGSDARLMYLEPPFRVMRCQGCGLVFLGNPPPEEELYEQYHSGSGATLADYGTDSSDPGQRELFAINQQRVRRLKELKPGVRLDLLDVGCGRGQFLKSATEGGFRAHGIDISSRAIAQAKREFGLSAEVSTLERLAESGRTFDIITLWHVLEHFIDPFQALHQIHLLLNDGGVCVIEVPNLYSLKFVVSRNKWEGGNHPLYHRTFFSATTLRQALIGSGFEKVHRMQWSYRLPGRAGTFEGFKRILDVVAMDAFLDFAAWK